MASAIISNTLYYGDNLDVLRKHFPLTNYFDLIYLDPPFNSKADYNVLFKEKSGKESVAQVQSFSDFWHWDIITAELYSTLQKDPELGNVLIFLHQHLGSNDMMAYLVVMTARLKKLHDVLKPTGSLYLHCDPTASHYLKVVLDTIFGVENFRNEIVWQRFNFHADAHRYGKVHDILLFYTKTNDYYWKTQYGEYKEEYKESHFYSKDPDGRRYRLSDSTAKGQGPPRYFKGKLLYPPHGTHWRWSQENIDRLVKEGKIVFTKTGNPAVKRYLDEVKPAVHSIWTDIPSINSMSKERIGFETQKPLKLLERIIVSSCPEGGVILDPFCGCGTTIIATEELNKKLGLNRKWVGIDITHLAISLIRSRLKRIHVYPDKDYVIVGEPVDFASATELMKIDKSGYQFQLWALSLIEDAYPSKVNADGKVVKGSDKGVDGWLSFKEGDNPDLKKIVISVKGGENIGVQMVRDLIGTVEARHSAMGILVTLFEPTEPMKKTALECGFYESPVWRHHYPKIQIITVDELLAKKKPNIPPTQ
jgi:site-specific DNA-methyltransferase (adenine-specific)